MGGGPLGRRATAASAQALVALAGILSTAVREPPWPPATWRRSWSPRPTPRDRRPRLEDVAEAGIAPTVAGWLVAAGVLGAVTRC